MVSVGVAMVIATVASAAITAVGAIQQGKARAKEADYNAKVADQNSVVARQQAQARAIQADRLNRLRIGTIQARHGASGGTSAQGSVLDILGDNAIQGELEKQNIIYEGELRARGYRVEAEQERMSGGAARTAGYMKAGSALVKGAAKAYSYS